MTPNQTSGGSPEDVLFQAFVASWPRQMAAELVPPLGLPPEDQRLTFLSPGRQKRQEAVSFLWGMATVTLGSGFSTWLGDAHVAP